MKYVNMRTKKYLALLLAPFVLWGMNENPYKGKLDELSKEVDDGVNLNTCMNELNYVKFQADQDFKLTSELRSKITEVEQKINKKRFPLLLDDFNSNQDYVLKLFLMQELLTSFDGMSAEDQPTQLENKNRVLTEGIQIKKSNYVRKLAQSLHEYTNIVEYTITESGWIYGRSSKKILSYNPNKLKFERIHSKYDDFSCHFRFQNLSIDFQWNNNWIKANQPIYDVTKLAAEEYEVPPDQHTPSDPTAVTITHAELVKFFTQLGKFLKFTCPGVSINKSYLEYSILGTYLNIAAIVKKVKIAESGTSTTSQQIEEYQAAVINAYNT